MKKEEIANGNKLIAEFVGGKKDNVNSKWYYFVLAGKYVNEEDLKYNSSWDALMPIVEKIETMGFEVRFEGISCKINRVLDRDNVIVNWVLGDKKDKIRLIYTSIVEFIKWHNNNN